MFGKKKISMQIEASEIARRIEAEKLRQMGPIPEHRPAPPVLNFLVMLKHGMAPVKVQASRHTFGQTDTHLDRNSKTTERYTHFIVDGPTHYVERVSYEGYRDGPRYYWAAQVSSALVFSIRTDDVLMIAEEGHCGEPTATEG